MIRINRFDTGKVLVDVVDIIDFTASIAGIAGRQIEGNRSRRHQGVNLYLAAQLLLELVQVRGVFVSIGEASAVDIDGTFVHQNDTVSDFNRRGIRFCLGCGGNSWRAAVWNLCACSGSICCRWIRIRLRILPI